MDEIQRTVEKPDYVILGVFGEKITIRKFDESKYLLVLYLEEDEVKTAFITKKLDKILAKRRVLWRA